MRPGRGQELYIDMGGQRAPRQATTESRHSRMMQPMSRQVPIESIAQATT